MNWTHRSSLVAALTIVAILFGMEQARSQSKQSPAYAASGSARGFYEPQRIFKSDTQVDQQRGPSKGPHAFWVQGGLGIASADIEYRDWRGWESFFHLNASGHFRRHNRVVAFGFDHQGIEAWGIKSWWGTYGVSHSRSSSESLLSLGVGLTQWYYHTESSRGTIRSDKLPSLVAKVQTIIHLPQTFGLGFVLSGNWNKESPYVAGSIVLALGLWNF